MALEGDQKVVKDIVEIHRKRRDVLVDGLNKIGWNVPKPKGTMFVWAPIPEQYRTLGSLEFAKLCIQEAKVAVSPGIGFGEYGEGYVRFALVENEQRTRQALRGLKTLNR
jgi:alanine-synthesizing transaminase